MKNNTTATASFIPTNATEAYDWLKKYSAGEIITIAPKKQKVTAKQKAEFEASARVTLRKITEHERTSSYTNCDSVTAELTDVYNIATNAGYTVNVDGKKKKATVKLNDKLICKVFYQKAGYKVYCKTAELFGKLNDNTIIVANGVNLPYARYMNIKQFEAFINDRPVITGQQVNKQVRKHLLVLYKNVSRETLQNKKVRYLL